MNISIGSNIRSGPWGGGNQFAINLSRYLEAHGHQVRFDLKDPRLDLIILTEPRTHLRISAFGSQEITRYLLTKNQKAIVLHRINVNEQAESNSSHTTHQAILTANKVADHTVFVSSWLKNLYTQLGFQQESSVILNGANTEIFDSHGHQRWNRQSPLKLVTHHWSANWFKGFDIYQKLDELTGTPKYNERISFTYIGHLPQNFKLHFSIYQPPLTGKALASILRQCHVYLTAARFESGSNHQNEGACCGLPLLYINSGSLPEYCEGYGIPYQPENFEEKLEEMIENYELWAERMENFPHTADRMCNAYELLFQELMDRRDEMIANRKWMEQPWFLLSAYFPRRPWILFYQKTRKVLSRWFG